MQDILWRKNMIRKLKLKFIALAMAALFVLLAVIVTGMNVVNYKGVVAEADELLSYLSQNKGSFPEQSIENIERPVANRFPPGFSPETPYESRYFSILIGDAGEILNTNTSQIVSIDEATAIEYAEEVYYGDHTKGFVDEYRYFVYSEMNATRILFLDCGRKLESFNSFLITSIAMSLVGYVAVSFAVFILSGKILRPAIESYEKQRQFITDAGHEIKTPLTIINANLDLLEMELGEDNESLHDIGQQTKRLRSLTEDLVMLTRMEEAENSLPKIDFPLSELVSETALSFKAPATAQEKEFICNIQPMLSLHGNSKSIEQLVCILLDNAMKYSPVGGTVAISLIKKGKTNYLTVFNTTQTEIKQDQLKRVFDRFYRTDNSRNSETGGHGIGLSVAQAIVTAHGGVISACSRDGHSFQITAEL